MGAYADFGDELLNSSKQKAIPAGAAILSQSEAAADARREKTPGNLAELDGEIKRTTDPKARAVLTSYRDNLDKAPSPYSSLGDELLSMRSAPVVVPVVQAKPDMLGRGQALQAEHNAPTQFRGILANQLTGLGSSIIGGYKGIATLLGTGSMDAAANAVNDYTSQHTYQGEGEPQEKAISSFASPANPINLPFTGIDAVADRTADRFGPAAGTAVKLGGNLGLLLLGTRGKPGTPAIGDQPATPGVGVYRPLHLPDNPSATLFSDRTLPKNAAPQMASSGGTTQANPAATVQNQATPPKPFSDIQPSETPPNLAEQQRRAQVLQSVGIDTTRKSALSGDPLAASTDLQTSKLDTPAGRYMRDVLDKEKQALSSHSEQLVNETGGMLNKDQSTQWTRGNTIVEPLNGLRDWFNQKAKSLYAAADQKSQGVPTNLQDFHSVLNDASEMTNSDMVHLRDAANAYVKKLGIMKDDGTISANVQQAETMRKYLNEKWSPQNSKFIEKLKESLDSDVTKTAGEDIYKESRQMWSAKKNTLDNPNGIAKLLQSEGPDGINRAIPYEQIGPKLAKMPVDQFGHIIDTLKNVPDELQPSAGSALSEVKAHFANEVRDIGNKHQGQWNAKGVTQFLRDNAARMSQVFTPEEMAKFQNLSEAGQLVAKDQSYPGAAVQEHNLLRSGAMAATVHGSTAVGGAVGSVLGPAGAGVGAAAGRYVGERAAQSMGDRASMKAAQQRVQKLSDLVRPRD